MTSNPVLNELIEERFYPIVTGAMTQLKGLLGFGGSEDSPESSRYDSSSPVRQSTSSSSSSTTEAPRPARAAPVRSNTTVGCHSPRTAGPPVRQTSACASLPSRRTYSAGVPEAVRSNSTSGAGSEDGESPRTSSIHSDLCRVKKRLSESPLRALSLDVSSRFESNHSNSSPVTRQSLSSTSDVEPLSSCAEEPDVNLEEPDYSAISTEKLGRIQFSVSYDFEALTLTVKIIKAEELAAMDLSGTSDPYVKISLLPDKRHTLTTNIKRKNLNPRWNEAFAFEGFPYNKVVTRTLCLVVFDYDRFSRDDPIGEVCIPLSDIDLSSGTTMWKTLQPCKGSVGKLGVILLSLCYQPAVGCITIVIIKARDLKAKDINGLSDPYVKIWLMHDGKKIEKKKTEIKEKTLNPIYNESFIFTVPYERIRQTSLVVSVMDYDRMGRNEAIGQIVLGTKSGMMEMKHWNEMFAKTKQNVTQWHILKDFG